MIINTKHPLLRFLTEGISAKIQDEPIPTNLCPYLRRVLLHVVISGTFGFIGGYLIFCAFLAPFLWFIDLTEGLRVVLILGTIVDIIAVAVGISWLLMKTGYKDRIEDSSHRVCVVIKNTFFWNWMRMLHDKICPEITFTSNDNGVEE